MKSKSITPIGVFAIAFGAIIGWGSFILPGDKFLPTSGIINTFIALLAGVFLLFIIEKNYQVMMNKFSSIGGEFSYTFSELGMVHAFLCGWFLSIAYFSLAPLNAGAILILLREIFPESLKIVYLYTIAGFDVYLVDVMIISLILVLFTWINVKGIHFASVVQVGLVAAMLLGLAGAVILILSSGKMTTANVSTYLAGGGGKIDVMKMLPILAIVPWVYVGFDTVVQVSSELTFSRKKASLMALLSIVVGFLFYNANNVIAALSYSESAVAAGTVNWAVGSSVRNIAGNAGLAFISIAMLAAVISGINGFTLAASRLICAIGQTGMIPKNLGKIDEKHGTPKNALILICVISIIAPWFGRKVLVWIVDMSATGAAIAYFYTSLSAMRVSMKDGKKTGVAFGLLGALISVFFLLLLLTPFLGSAGMSMPSLIALAVWFLLGVVFYALNNKRVKKIAPEKIRKILLQDNNV